MLYSYSFANKRRDLTDVLSTVIANSPQFINLFPVMPYQATQRKHEWLEDQMTGRSVVPTANSSNVLTVSAADAAKLTVGTQLVPAGDSALFGVTAISGTSVTVALLAANGSATITPTNNVALNIVSTPIAEGSTSGVEIYNESGVAYNCTQIFRHDAVLSGSAMSISVYGEGIEEKINRQVEFSMQDLVRSLNRAALFGHRVEAATGTVGALGGLYEFGTQDGGLSVAASGAALDSYIVNDAAAAVLGAGGVPSVIVCSPGQARVLSAEFSNKVQVLRADAVRGSYVAAVTNAINGSEMRIFVEPDIPDTDVWVIDPAGFGLVNLFNRGISDQDSTAQGFDGIRRTILGELTLQFKNAKQRLCRISGLEASATALASKKAGVTAISGTVDIGNTVDVSGSTVTTISGGTV